MIQKTSRDTALFSCSYVASALFLALRHVVLHVGQREKEHSSGALRASSWAREERLRSRKGHPKQRVSFHLGLFCYLALLRIEGGVVSLGSLIFPRVIPKVIELA